MIDELFLSAIEKAVERAVKKALAEQIPTSAGPELLTIAGAAELSGFGVTTVREWLRAGKLKRYGKGRAVRIKRTELLLLLDTLRTKPGATLQDLERRADELLRRH